MLAGLIIGCVMAAGPSRPTTAQSARQPTEWGELFRWLRVSAVVPTTQPAAGKPIRLDVWAEAVGQTARLMPDEASAFCILRAGESRYFSQKLRPTDPIELQTGGPKRVLSADLLGQRFFATDGKLKIVDGYPAPKAGQPPPDPAGRGRDLFKMGQYKMLVCVYVAQADGRPAAMARSRVVTFEIIPPKPTHLTAEQQAVYDRLAPKFRRGVVSASKAAPEAVTIGARAVPALKILLGRDEPHYARAWATDTLCKIVDPAATAVLREIIRTPGLGERDVMAYHLMPRRDRDANELIVELLQTRKGPVPRLWIARGFVDYRRKFHGKAAELLLASRSPKVLYLCGMALRRGAFKKGDTQRLVDRRGDEGLRQQAAAALIDAVEHADADLRPHIFAALTTLTGMQHKTIADWQAWKARHVDK